MINQKPIVTFILLSHNDDYLLYQIVDKFLKANLLEAKMQIVDSGDSSRLKISDERISILDNQSNGIYAAMNAGVSSIETPYYIVLGLDDEFYFNLFEMITNLIKQSLYKIDLIFLGVEKNNNLLNKFTKINIHKDPIIDFPSHTAGIVIKKELHNTHGLYNLKFKVCADQFFISKCLKDNKTRIDFLNNIFSNIGHSGYSKVHELKSELELLNIRLNLGDNFFYYAYLFVRNFSKRILKKFLRL